MIIINYHPSSSLLQNPQNIAAIIYYIILPLATQKLAQFQLLSKDERIKKQAAKRILMSHYQQHQKNHRKFLCFCCS